MKKLAWFDRQFTFGLASEMLPFYLERLAGTFSRLQEKVKGYSEELLSVRLDDKWSVKQNIGHLAEVDEIANRRIDEIKGGSPYMSPAVFELKVDHNAKTIDEVLEYFKDCRNRNLAKYNSLTENDLAKSSVHPRLKVPMSLVDLAWFDAEHDDHHSVRINEIIWSLISQRNLGPF
jgi:uncharacterized damage-inducible protein DinB